MTRQKWLETRLECMQGKYHRTRQDKMQKRRKERWKKAGKEKRKDIRKSM